MKRVLLFSTLMLLLAAAAMASTGPLGSAGSSINKKKAPVGERGDRGDRGDDHPAAPVPEPGTMALASMGLIALGAAARGRRK